MEININNYQEVIVDFLDGKLEENDVANLWLFLEQNSTIKAEFDILNSNLVVIEPELTSTDFSNLIKKEKINVSEYSNKLIALLEGDLTLAEKNVLEADIKNYPELATELALFKQTKLIADSTIIFKNKEQLKKKGGLIIPIFVRYSSIAALFIAVIIVFYFINNTNTNNQQIQANIATEVAKSKQDSITNIIKNKNNISKQLQQENEKQMMAFGGINPAVIQKKKGIQPTNSGVKQIKKPTKENPLNNNNGQSINPPILPKKVIADNRPIRNSLALINEPQNNETKPVEVLPTPINNNQIVNKEPITMSTVSTETFNGIATYLKQQLASTAQAEVIAVNKPIDADETVSLGESIGLNMLLLFNRVSSRDVKIKKTYNNNGEVEKVQLVANGW